MRKLVLKKKSCLKLVCEVESVEGGSRQILRVTVIQCLDFLLLLLLGVRRGDEGGDVRLRERRERLGEELRDLDL